MNITTQLHFRNAYDGTSTNYEQYATLSYTVQKLYIYHIVLF